MQTSNHPTTPNNAGFPPAPPEAHQRAVFKYLDLSTGHLSYQTMQWANGIEQSGTTISLYDYGLFISVPPTEDSIEELDCPDDLKVVLRYALQHYCFVIRFDSDGDINPELLIFNL